MGGSGGGYAWVTSVAGEDQVDTALILGRSLRRVRSAFKLVAIIAKSTASLSKGSKGRLEEEFDLVVVDHDDDDEEEESARRRSREETEKHLKAVSYSLCIFDKVAYLAPSMMVLRNCDELFDKVIVIGGGGGGDPSSSSLDHYYQLDLEHALTLSAILFYPTKGLVKEVMEAKVNSDEGIIQQPKFNYVVLDEAIYNVQVVLGKDGRLVANSSTSPSLFGSIINFVAEHPCDLRRNGVNMEQIMSEGCCTLLDKLAISTCLSILTQEGSSSAPPTGSPGKGPSSEPVAVVGLSFRLPGANNVDELWDLLIQGKDAVGPVPPNRWTPQHTRHSWKKESNVEAGFLQVPIDEFDAKFFGISPKEAATLDPQQRLLLEVSWEALEEAGIDPLSLRGTPTGVFVGSWLHEYKEEALFSPDYDFFRSYMGNAIGMESARLSHFLGCIGPSISTESACSSSFVAVELAVQGLRRREINLALASGVNLILNPFTAKTIDGVFSPDYRCKTFDAGANGYVRAEGVATLVLKRLGDALRDGDNVWGLIRGIGMVEDGISKSLGTPTLHCEARAMELALRDAGLDGGDVDFVEAHGTGTPVGDPMEVAAIAKAYQCSPPRAEPLIIGSGKTNIGHTESVSGIAGMIKVLLSMRNELIPPHRNLGALNPQINLNAIPAIIPQTAVPWLPNGRRRRVAGVSCFGFTGTEGHLILEEPPPEVAWPANNSTLASSSTDRPLHILKLSAKTAKSLDMMVTQYEALLETNIGNGNLSFENICYSTNTGRAASFSHRAVVLAKDGKEALGILKARSFPTADLSGGRGSSSSGICFLFTGQGSQYPGMGSELYATSPLFRLHFDEAARILQEKHNICVVDAMWKRTTPSSGDGAAGAGQDLLSSSSLHSQTSIFCLEYALFKLWECWGVSPDYVLGHSLGEFAAAVAAGILGLEEALELLVVRSRLIENLPPGRMLAVKGSREAVSEMITKFQSSKKEPHFWADFAALNSPEQTVVAGDPEMIQEFGKFCSERGLQSVMLASAHAFHSRHIDPILEEVGKAAAAASTSSSSPQRSARLSSRGRGKEGGKQHCPKYISGVEGRLVEPHELGPDYWKRHTRDKVNFLDACKTAKVEGVTLFLELGPHPVLSALVMRNMEGTGTPIIYCLPSLRRTAQDWAVLLDTLGKLYLSGWKGSGSIDWKGVDLGYSTRVRVPLPFYPFDRKSAWLQVRPEEPALYPLLGRRLPTATASSHHLIYEKVILLKSLPYLQDHVFGNTVIFPGAAFLEMCLCAGFASATGLTTQQGKKPRRPIGLQDLKLLAPMGIPLHDSGGGIHLQTLTSFENGIHRIQICREDKNGGGGGGGWVSHAVSEFLPGIVSSSSGDFADLERPLELSSLMMAGGGGEPWDCRQFYQNLPKVGVKFGPAFQSLECAWEGEQGTLLKVKTLVAHDDDDDDKDSYLIHPVLADAMLQALLVSSGRQEPPLKKNKLRLPISIGQFVWLRSSSNPERYIHVDHNNPKQVCCWTTLVDGEGVPLAAMRSVEFVETSVKLLEGRVTQVGDVPMIWEEVYHKSVEATSCDKALMGGPSKYAWIIFGGDDDPLTQGLEEDLIGWNRTVVSTLVTKPSSCDEEQRFKESLKRLVTRIRDTEEDLVLEGVLYLWGLSRSDDSRGDQLQISLPLLSLIQVVFTELLETPRIVVVTSGVHFVEDGSSSSSTLSNPFGGTLTGLIRSIHNENPGLQLAQIDLPLEEESTTPESQRALITGALWRNQQDQNPLISVLRGGGDVTLTPKLVAWKPQNERYLQLPVGMSRFQLLLPDTGLISDLEFTFLQLPTLEEDWVEVEVKAAGLGCFRDVLAVRKPATTASLVNRRMMDYSGVVTKVGGGVTSRKVGDRVMGMNLDERWTMPSSHVQAKAWTALSLPDSMTFAEGATLPSAFFTAYHALVTVAGLREGNILLVHSATGEVGLAAIQLAAQAGAEVIATAGSERKREYLRRRLLGITHVFNSRSGSFSTEILRVTHGVGVDIVLMNSLNTSPELKEESLRALRPNGSFVELSQENVWSREEVVERGRADVKYTIIDLTTSSLSSDSLEHLHHTLENYLMKRLLVHPIPYERFDGLNIRGALNYLQQDGEHIIGSVVCVMPEMRSGGSGEGEGGFYADTPLFNEQSTYLVTGGLGGIGFEVVRWILASGGKHVVILSRRAPNPQIRAQIESLNRGGGMKHVETFEVNVGNWEEVRGLFDRVGGDPTKFSPIRGVMHCAGVLSDGLMENQSWTKFRETYNAKVEGSWNLHQLTKDLPLEHFVLFSSISATFGSPGQANHSASNSFLDALANYRTSIGLPATSVDWGNWGEVGIATELDFPGISPIRTAQGIAALELFLRTGVRRAVVANIDSFPMLTTLFPNCREVVDDKLLFGHQPLPNNKFLNTDEFWAEIDGCSEREGKLAVLLNLIKATVRNILRLEAGDVIEDHTDFTSLGVDSLMMLELKSGVQAVLGPRLVISATDLKDGSTAFEVATRLLKMLEGSRWETNLELPSLDELKLLVREDSILPENIMNPRSVSLLLEAKGIEQVESILLTGVTGNLGPYLLRELSGREGISKIICLIRTRGKASPMERLLASLQKAGLEGEVDMSKVEVLLGNIAEVKFGLAEGEYNALAGSVDAVTHIAVRADHDAKYWKAPPSKRENMRTVNIGGTLSVLRFCSQTRLKHLFYASTMWAVGDVNEDGRFPEDWEPVGSFDGITYNWGYLLTKHVAEQLVRQAVERGLPAKAFRFPLVGGDSRDGRVDHQNNHFMLRCMAALDLKAMADCFIPLLYMPVDHCARFSLALFFNPKVANDVYNINNEVNPDREDLLVQVAKEEFGIDVEVIPPDQFTKLIEAQDDSAPLALFRRLYSEDQFATSVIQNVGWLKAYDGLENREGFFTCDKIKSVFPDIDKALLDPSHCCLRRDLRYLRDTGVFQKFGIECFKTDR